jgi:GTP-binding protein
MVETYLRMRENLRAVVVILDIRRDPSRGDLDLFQWLNQFGIVSIPVLTKSDKLSRQKAARRAEVLSASLEPYHVVPLILFSAKTRVGRQAIWQRINSILPGTGTEL